MLNGGLASRVNIMPTELVINDESNDLDFRVESDNDANAFFVWGEYGHTGLGTTTPDKKLVVSDGGAQGIELSPAESGVSRLFSYNRSSNAYTPINIQGSDLRFGAGTSNTERMRITSDGVTFNGDTAAANALDDYEEGTWTPQLIGTSGSAGSYAQQTPNAHYTKVGRLVTIQCTFYVTNKGSYSGKTRMTGLPFASATSTTALSLGSFPDSGYGTTSGNVLIAAQVDGAQNYIAFFDGSRLDPRHDYADVGTGYYINVAGSYMAAT